MRPPFDGLISVWCGLSGAVNRQWEDLILAFVGDQFDCADDICGVVVSVRFKDQERKRDSLSVWIKDIGNNVAKEKIGQQVTPIFHPLSSLSPPFFSNCFILFQDHTSSPVLLLSGLPLSLPPWWGWDSGVP